MVNPTKLHRNKNDMLVNMCKHKSPRCDLKIMTALIICMSCKNPNKDTRWP